MGGRERLLKRDTCLIFDLGSRRLFGGGRVLERGRLIEEIHYVLFDLNLIVLPYKRKITKFKSNDTYSPW